MQLGELHKHVEEFEKHNAAVWAISIDPVESIQAFRKKAGIAFPLLRDPDSETIRRYGILNEDHGKIPHPAAFVVDTAGVVRYARIDVQYMNRPSSREILDVLQGADDEAE